MKKFITIFSILLFLSFSINTITTLTQVTEVKKFGEGFYNINDLGFMENVSYSVQNSSIFNEFLIVFDSDQKVQQAISLEPQSTRYPLKPMEYTDRIVILGRGELTFF